MNTFPKNKLFRLSTLMILFSLYLFSGCISDDPRDLNVDDTYCCAIQAVEKRIAEGVYETEYWYYFADVKGYCDGGENYDGFVARSNVAGLWDVGEPLTEVQLRMARKLHKAPTHTPTSTSPNINQANSTGNTVNIYVPEYEKGKESSNLANNILEAWGEVGFFGLAEAWGLDGVPDTFTKRLPAVTDTVDVVPVLIIGTSTN